MKTRIVADSSANQHTLPGMDVSYVPLHIVTDEKEYIDDPSLDLDQMLRELKAYKGKSGTSCPNTEQWLKAFGDADEVFAVSITSHLSGCYNSARIAAEEYAHRKPGAKVYIHDSLSTGPEMQLVLEKLHELISAGKDFEAIRSEIREYSKHTQLYFMLSSLDNLAKNGRVSMLTAKAAGILGIRVIGRASTEGTLESLHKCRGERKALVQLIECLREAGFNGGKIRITHTANPAAAQQFADIVRGEWPGCDMTIASNTGLCGFYAESGSIMVGFEGR